HDVQLAVHARVAPKPSTHTCWCRHWPPGGVSSAVVHDALPGLVFHEMVVHLPGRHLPRTTPASPKHTAPWLHGKFGIVPNMIVSLYFALPDLPGAVLLLFASTRITSTGWLITAPSGTR